MATGGMTIYRHNESGELVVLGVTVEWSERVRKTIKNWDDVGAGPGTYAFLSAKGTRAAEVYTDDAETKIRRNYPFVAPKNAPVAAATRRWQDEQATSRQIEYMAILGIEIEIDGMTKGRASELIEAARNSELGSVGGWYSDGSN